MLAALIRIAVQRRGVVIVSMIALLALGLYQLSRASLDIFPEFAGKRVVIQTEAPGLSTELVENLVTVPLERALAGLLGVERLRSESIQGLSVIVAVFQDDTDLFRDRQLVGERVATASVQLPPGIGPPVLVPLASSSATVLTLGLSSERRSLLELRDLVDWTITPRLLAVPGVADVNVFGGERRQLQIQVDGDKLWQYGIDLAEVEQVSRRVAPPHGIGFLENANQRFGLVLSPVTQVAATLRNMLLLRGPQGNVTVADVAAVVPSAKPSFSAAQIMGKPAIVLMVIGQYGANTLQVSRAVEQALAEFRQSFAHQDIELYPRLFRPADYIERSVRNLAGHLLIGAVLVITVLYAFLFDLRASCIAALAIPLSLLGAIVVLLNQGVNLNIMVLGGLAIALGEVVDDAIIDTENIARRLRENLGRTPPLAGWKVVQRASLEVRGSVVYASFIVALVFVPLLTLGGVAGRLFTPLGYTYILAVLMSLGVALTVTPALCSLLLERHTSNEAIPPLTYWLRRSYRHLLENWLRRPMAVLAGALLICAAALAWLPGLGGEFLPQLREGHFIVHTASLPGTSLQESIRLGSLLTAQLRELPGVESVSQWAGRAERGADTYGTHYSEYEVRLTASAAASGTAQQAVLDRVRDLLGEFPGIAFEVNTFLVERVDETISGYTAPVVINLYGTDLERLDEKARETAALVATIDGATGIQVRSPPGTPLAEIRFHHDQLASWGLRPLEVIDSLETAYAGKVVGRYYEGNRGYDIALILAPDRRARIESVKELPLLTADGTLIKLAQVAEVRQTGGRYNILHQNAQRVQTVTSGVGGRDPQSFINELRTRVLSEIRFPPDIYPDFTGSAVEQRAARAQLMMHSLLAATGVVLLIYLALGSVRHLLLTLLNLPFSLAGGVAAAVWTGSVLSVGSMVGFVTLFGVTVRNTIMLVAHYRHLVEVEHQDWTIDTAIRGAEERLPAIMMTALVTALAMLPIAIGSDSPGREIMGPMAAIIVGGLFSSTALNLLVLPVVLWRWGRFGRVRKTHAK